MKLDLLTEDCIKWVQERYLKKYSSFDMALAGYKKLKEFKISDNIFESGQNITEQEHYVMRLVTQYYMEKVFDAMLIDKNDENVAGEKGTPYRWVKMYCGSNLEDDTEMLSGRWSKKPRIATFPNEHKQKFPITKRVDVISNCSHHTLAFSSLFRDDSYAIISYIPEEKILGISKLQRIVDWVARRGHLQEGLSQMLYEEISKVSETKNVYIKLANIVHTCESLRGSQSKEGAFTSEYYGGEFDDLQLRKEVQESIR